MTHKRQMIAALAIVALVGTLATGTAVAGDPTTGVLPTANDVYANWSNAGLAVIGGIPNRTTICATVNPLGGGQDDLSNIQTAIDHCPAGEVVQLGSSSCAPSCVFSITMSEFISLNKSITLRGYGTCNNAGSPYCPTVIQVSNGALPTYANGGTCGTSTSNEVACVSNPAIFISPMADGTLYDYGWSGCDHNARCNLTTLLAADAAQGSTTVQVTNTASFSVGMWVLIDEATGAGWQTAPNGTGQVWAAPDWLSSSSSPATGRVSFQKNNPTAGDFGAGAYPYQANSPGCWYSNCDRLTAELHLIASIGAGPCPGTGCTLTFDDPLTVAYRVGGGTSFTGSITGTTLTTSSGTPAIGQMVCGTSVPQNTYITAGSGTSWTVSRSATVSSEAMTSGCHGAAVYWPTLQGNNTPLPFLQQVGIENLSVERATNGNITMLFCAYCWVKNVETFGWASGGVNLYYTVRSQIDTVYDHDCYDCENNGTEYAVAISSASTENLLTNSIIRFSGKGMVGRTGTANVISYNYQDDTFYMASSIGDYWIDNGVNGSHYAGTHHFLFEGNWGDTCGDDWTHGNTVYHVYFRNWCNGLRTPFTDPSNGYSENDYTAHAWQTGGRNPSAAGPLRAVGIEVGDYWEAYVGNVLGVAGTTTSANKWVYSAQSWHAGQTGNIWLLGWNDGNSTAYDPNLGGSTPYLFRHGNYDYLNNAVSWDPNNNDHNLPNSFYLRGAPVFFGGYTWPWVNPTGSSQLYTLPAKRRYDAGTPFAPP
jgi:hypothetical protein